MDFQPYALTFAPRLEERVWGGRNLERYGKELPAGKSIGESWEISDVEAKSSLVARGQYLGFPLGDLVSEHRLEILGPRAGEGPFPLLLKLLDAREILSVQVHPSDDDLRRAGFCLQGKAEAWVILEAEPGAEILHGLPQGVARKDVAARMRELHGGALPAGEERSLFRWVGVAPGDVVFVPAGTVHALGAGIVLLEVQQTSDVTYRIYDWGRPRQLHPQWVELVREPEEVKCPWTAIGDARASGVRSLLSCEKFRLELVTLAAGQTLPASTLAPGGAVRAAQESAFHILAGLDGETSYASRDGDRLELRRGDFALLPAALGEYKLSALQGGASCLRVLGPSG